MKPRRGADSAAGGRVRIIAGRWRGSRIEVPEAAGLRPTSDRVRETLFNWLAPQLTGAHCLDLFAGSGALGFEAGSRGAATVTMIESDARLAANLRLTSQRLNAEQVSVVTADALPWLAALPAQAFDIVFVDPPFGAGLLEASLAAVEPHLAAQAWIYVECARDQTPVVAADWRLHREGATREVRYALYARSPEDRKSEWREGREPGAPEGRAVGPATLAAASEAASESSTR